MKRTVVLTLLSVFFFDLTPTTVHAFPALLVPELSPNTAATHASTSEAKKKRCKWLRNGLKVQRENYEYVKKAAETTSSLDEDVAYELQQVKTYENLIKLEC